MKTITIMRYLGNGQHKQITRYKEGESTQHLDKGVHTEEQFSVYVKSGIADDLAPLTYSLIR